jgi:glycosyltransferase involved in cell wall biosynthesis
MKNSQAASILAYIEAVKWDRERMENYTDVFICPSQFMANKIVQGGFPANKTIVLNNFIDTEKIAVPDSKKENYYCYVGRLSSEKGVATLIRAARNLPYKLKVIGKGDLTFDSADNIEFLGYKPWEEIREIVSKARFTVIPSEWYENNPLSIIESLCLGTPVLGANIGGIPELIDEEKNGWLFESGNETDLSDKIKLMFENQFASDEIAVIAQQRFSGDKYYAELMKIYNP